MGELPANMKNIWKIVPFSLVPLGFSNIFIKKNLKDNSIEIKNIDKDFFAQAYKYFIGKPVSPNDMKAMKDGYIITYDEPYNFN